MSSRQALTIFTWGYWGWGASTPQFVEAAGAVENARGYTPPVFVDVRISRSVRAPGFNGSRFEQTVGPSHYRWMPSLGNVAVLEGGHDRIQDPAAAADLLDLAADHHAQGRRLLFFCSCEYPRGENGRTCHRATVAGLVLQAAQRRGLDIEIIEWPGGEPGEPVRISVPAGVLRSLDAGQKSIRLGEQFSLANVAGIPWYSVAEVSGKDRKHPSRDVLTGPAKFDKKRGWWLPRLEDVDPAMSRQALRQHIRTLRTRSGFEPRATA
jgi:hypothetical protein